MIASLAVKSLRNRKFTAGLTVLSIALAVALLLGVEHVRSQSRTGFAATVSGTDLIVGARSSPVHLLLYSVFRVGNATSNLSWQSAEMIAGRPEVAWTIPLSLGDSHRGFRVLGTTGAYFDHFRFAGGRRLELREGSAFRDARDAVVGADVAEKLGYKTGDSIVIAHGAGDVAFSLHDRQPFRVSGILRRTGTPVDRTVHIPLAGLEALHAENDESFDPLTAMLRDAHEEPAQAAAQPRAVTALLVGLKSRAAALGMQRMLNEYAAEPLTAILPGVTLQELWEITGAVERTLLAVSGLVVGVGLAGMLIALLTNLSERRREMAVLRSVGARPVHVFGLILGEAATLTAAGILGGMATLYLGMAAGQPWLESSIGLFVDAGWPSAHEWMLMLLVAVAGILIGLVPAWRIYRYSLADGMTIRM